MQRITLGRPFPPAAHNPIFDGPVHMQEHFADRDEARKLNVAEVTFNRRGALGGTHTMVINFWS